MAQTRDLPRRIGFWSAAAILVGTTIGSGIFRSPAGVADRLPAPGALVAVWVAGGVLALCGALTVAELASRFPETGGIYVFIREGWGRLPAFLFGWAELVIIRAAALGAIATTFAEYALRVAGYDPKVAPHDAWVHYVAAGAILVVGGCNYIGVRWGTLVQNVLTVVKCGGLVGLVVLALVMTGAGVSGDGSAGAAIIAGHAGAATVATSATAPGATTITLGGFGLALISVLWVYDGWADVSFVAGEVRDPVRNLPRVLIAGTLAVTAIYVLANIAYLAVLPVSTMRHAPLVAADVAGRLLGTPGATAMGVVVMLSSFGALNGSMLTGPRVLWAMARDGLLFRPLAAVHPRFATPHVAVTAATALGVAFVSVRSFEQLADIFVTAILPFYALAVAAVFPLRRREREGTAEAVTGSATSTWMRALGSTPFRVPGYPIVPILFIVATIVLLLNAVMVPTARTPSAIVAVVIMVGVPIFRRRSASDTSPAETDTSARERRRKRRA